eukprot:COSAG06_NODE_18572_length_880_cov_1.320102_2_plen_88_part_00
MNEKKIADLSFGQDNEIRVKQRLERLFGPLETTKQMDEFDFKNDDFIIELKSRRGRVCRSRLGSRAAMTPAGDTKRGKRRVVWALCN